MVDFLWSIIERFKERYLLTTCLKSNAHANIIKIIIFIYIYIFLIMPVSTSFHVSDKITLQATIYHINKLMVVRINTCNIK